MEPDPGQRGPVPVVSARRADVTHAAIGVTWKDPGRAPNQWSPALVAAGVASALFGLILAVGLADWLPGLGGRVLSSLSIWLGMAIPVAVAFAWSRPLGLLRFHPADLVYGLVLGVIVRFTQGWLELAAGGMGAFPSFTRVDGALLEGWLLFDVFSPGIIAPVVEEFFFRGLLLVGVYAALRRPFGGWTASFVAWVASTALFALAHLWGATATWDSVAALLVLGGVCGMLVVLTGRIWAAVLVHVTYNGSYVLLALIGSVA